MWGAVMWGAVKWGVAGAKGESPGASFLGGCPLHIPSIRMKGAKREDHMMWLFTRVGL